MPGNRVVVVECAEPGCDAPATWTTTFYLGVDQDFEAVYAHRVTCAKGHWYIELE